MAGLPCENSLAENRTAGAQRDVADGARGGAAGQKEWNGREGDEMVVVSYRFGYRGWVGVADDPFDDVGAAAQFLGPLLEVFATGTAAIQHLG